MSEYAVTFKVYRIRFEDGSEYIGSTYRDPHERLTEHRNRGENDLLTSKFDSGLNYEFKVVSTHKYRADAVAVERELMLAAKQPINVYLPSVSGFGRKLRNPRRGEFSFRSKFKKRDMAPGMGYYVCSKCRVRKHGEEFQPDRSRFNGRYSQCKVCQKQAKDARLQRLRDEGLCQYCGKQPRLPGQTQCEKCRERNKTYCANRVAGITLRPRKSPPSSVPPAIDYARRSRGDRLRANYQRVLKELHEKYDVPSLHD